GGRRPPWYRRRPGRPASWSPSPPPAGARTRAHRPGACWRAWAPSSPSFLGSLAAVERKHLGWVQQPLGVEHCFDPHLHGKVGLGELDRHEIALFNADPVLAGEAAAESDAELENLMARLLRTIGLRGVVGIIEHERMQVAVAGVKDVGSAH